MTGLEPPEEAEYQNVFKVAPVFGADPHAKERCGDCGRQYWAVSGHPDYMCFDATKMARG